MNMYNFNWWVTLHLCQIPIFEKGYEKDPAIVAKEAIQEATRNGSDVVLVDTAGRMQVIYMCMYIYIYMPYLKGCKVDWLNCSMYAEIFCWW